VRITILLFCLLIQSSSWSQARIDSLRNLIDETDSQEKKVDVINSLAFELFDYSLEDAIQTAGQALNQSRRIGYKKGEAWALIHHGSYHSLAGRITTAKRFYKSANSIGIEILDDELRSYSTLQLGKLDREIGNFDSALFFYKEAEALQLARPVPSTYSLCRIYSALSRNYVMQDKPDDAMLYAKREMEQATKLKEKEWTGYAWMDIGDAHRNKYEFDKAYVCYKKAKNEYGSFSWVGIDVYESIGIAQIMQGEYDSAFQSFNIVMQAYDTYQGKHALARNLIKMGEVLEVKALYDIAQEYLAKALQIAEASGYVYLAAEAYDELAWVNYGANHLQAAELNARKARVEFASISSTSRIGEVLNILGLIKMKALQYDSSLYYHQQALTIREKINNQTGLSATLFNIGELFLRQQKLSEALPFFKKGVKIDEAIKDKYGMSMYYNRIGRIYMNQGKSGEAESFLNSAISLAKGSGSLDILSAAYNDYSLLQERAGNLKEALRYRKLYEASYDSIYTKGTAQSLISYRMLYDLASKDQQITLLNKDRQIQDDTIKKRNLIIYWAISFSLTLVVLVYVLFRSFKRHRKMNRDLAERSEEIQTQSEELTESNQALLRLNTEIERQSEEIKAQAEELKVSNTSIAKINEGLEKMVEQRTTDLRGAYQELDTFFYRSSHDFRRPLTTLMGLAEVAKLSVKDSGALELFEKVNATARNLDKMLVKLQSISDVGSHQLVFKEVLLKQVIDNTFEPFRDWLREKQAAVTIDINLNKPCISYPALIKIAIENIVENAIIFGDPFKPAILVRVFREGLTVIVEVDDNGEGIHPDVKPHIFEMFYRGSERSTGNGLGLYIAQKAMEKISGKISFVNNENKAGATFRIMIPDLQP
jgi:signal transduction histidine kinase